MREITGDAINSAIERLGDFGEQAFDALYKKMEKEQPAIMGYLAEAEDELNDDERDFLTQISVVGWHIITTAMGARREVSDDLLDSQFERNIGLFENYSEDKGAPGSDLRALLSTFNGQGALMDFLMSMLVDRPESFEGEIRDEMVPAMMIHMKTVIDCLICRKNNKAGDR
jgi:hypothetical protein